LGAAAAVTFGHALGLPLLAITLVLAVGMEILGYSPPPPPRSVRARGRPDS
jgi:hypothetical protein